MTRYQWLKDAGERYLHQIRNDEIEFLSEIDISPEDTSELLNTLANSHDLPLEPWANVCVALAAVLVARDASENDRAFVPLFMRAMKLEPNQNAWQDRYGWRVENVIHKFFPDDYRSEGGAFRYVGPIYRHVGVPVPALPRFARFIRKLLDENGPYLSRQYFEEAKEAFQGIAAKFLSSEHGYQFASNSVRILHKIEIGEIRAGDLNNISGYRHGFWSEVVAQIPKAQPRIAGRPISSLDFPEPILALVPEDGRLILRFERAGVAANAYRLDRSLVSYAEMRVTPGHAPTLQIGQRIVPIARWWAPDNSNAAVFRESDGGFVTDQGNVPPGNYWVTLRSPLRPPTDWQPEEGVYLDETDFQIWHVAIPPASAFEEISSTNSRPLPELRFTKSGNHVLGRAVFESSLPPITLTNWDHQNASRFQIFLEDESGRRSVNLEPGTATIKLEVHCPSRGFLRIEPKGLMRQSSALPTLPFTILPEGVEIAFTDSGYGPNERAFIRSTSPPGWNINFNNCKLSDGLVEVPEEHRLLEGTVGNGKWITSFGLRVPRYSIILSNQEFLLWKDGPYRNDRVHIEGVHQHQVRLQLAGSGNRNLTGWLSMPSSGTISKPFVDFVDALEHPEPIAAEFVLNTFSGKLIPSGWHFAVESRILENLSTGRYDVEMYRLPEIGTVLEDAVSILKGKSRELRGDLGSAPVVLRRFLANLFFCAATFDGHAPPISLVEWTDPTVVEICDWYIQASAWSEPGAKATILAARAPERLIFLALQSWRDHVRQQIGRLQTLGNLNLMVAKWRQSIRLRDGSDSDTDIGRRPKGDLLSEGARKYYMAMLHRAEKARNRELVAAIGSLRSARDEATCGLVREIADLLLALAYQKYGRGDLIEQAEMNAAAQLGLCPGDVSPWEGDYGNDERSRAVATGSISDHQF